MVSFIPQTLYPITLGRGGWMGLRASVMNALEERKTSLLLPGIML